MDRNVNMRIKAKVVIIKNAPDNHMVVGNIERILKRKTK